MNFDELGLAKRIVADLESLGFVEPTEIQQKSIPPILAGRDIMASAETGSGKTAAYALPIIQALRNGSERKPRVLVLVPTRELALQVDSQFERFSNKCGIRTVTIYGGVGFEKQNRLLSRGVDVIVATPGRLYDHIERGNADLSNIKMLVLDEADRMLDMGFTPQVRKIVAGVPKTRQTIMFSATISKVVEQSAEEFLKDPVNVFVNTKQVEPSSIDQKLYHVTEDGKDDLLVKLIKENPDMSTVLVFTKTRWKAAKICKKLTASDLTADEIHGDISQHKRERTLTRYRAGEFAILVATDIAARGLDIPAISHVVNYDLPMSAADYVHRIGRTGRAGRAGVALSFVSADQRYLVREIEKITGHALDPNGPAMPQDSHRRGGTSRPGRSNRNTAGSGHRRRPEDPTQFGGGVFGTRREPRDQGDSDSGFNRGRNDAPRNGSSRPAFGNGGGREGYRGNSEGRSDFRPSRSGFGDNAGSREPRSESSPGGFNKFAGNREGGEARPARNFDRPSFNRESGGRSFDRPAFNRERGGEARPARSFDKPAGNREDSGDSRPARPSFDKPAGNREGSGEPRPFNKYAKFGGEVRESRYTRNGSGKIAGNRDVAGESRPERSSSDRFTGNRDSRSEFRPNRETTSDSRPAQSGSDRFSSNRDSRSEYRPSRPSTPYQGNREGAGESRPSRGGSGAVGASSEGGKAPFANSRWNAETLRSRPDSRNHSSSRTGFPSAGKPRTDGVGDTKKARPRFGVLEIVD
jgi:ATP-dependent RNA helicase RhlE